MMYDIVIIGAGTAGLSAAIYGVRAGKTVLILESSMFGGQIVNSRCIENYPGIPKVSGYEFSKQLYEQAVSLGAEYRSMRATNLLKKDGSFTVLTEEGKEELSAKTVIVAAGAKHRTLDVPGEEKLKGQGVSYCAACDGAFFRNQEVAVVGGGSTALSDAAVLSDYCKKVYLIHRRDTFRGEAKLVERLKEKENVEFILNSRITAIHGEEAVESVTVEDISAGGTKELPVQGVFVAVGQVPDNQMAAGLVELDDMGYIISGEDCKTSCPGIFAAGDCRTKEVRQLVTAAADGAVAALAACEFMI